MPQLSIIMPVKDGGPYIEDAVRSIQSQALRDWELVVVDDHSTDDSARRAADLGRADARIRVVANPGRGQVQAINFGYGLVRGDRLPFPDASFDRVAVVDMLEHVPDEGAFAAELARVTRPGGLVVVNTPHLKRTLLRRLRHALGQTDEKHGHLRPGYTPERLRELFSPAFEVEGHRTYSRFFSEAVDTALNWGMERLGKKSSAKGMVVTADDLARNRGIFRAYSAVYPLVWAVTRLDALVPASGYMLVASLRRRAV
jgi:glycosyltransferase involved in cell wall biosynthesis